MIALARKQTIATVWNFFGTATLTAHNFAAPIVMENQSTFLESYELFCKWISQVHGSTFNSQFS